MAKGFVSCFLTHGVVVLVRLHQSCQRCSHISLELIILRLDNFDEYCKLANWIEFIGKKSGCGTHC